MSSSAGFAFSATHGMIDRVHGHTPDVGPAALPAAGSGLSRYNEEVLGVSNRSDGGHAVHGHHAGLPGGHSQCGVASFPCHQLDRSAGASGKLSALAGFEFNVVYGGSQGYP